MKSFTPHYRTNLFYANIDPKNHPKLAQSVQSELGNLRKFIDRAIDGIRSNTFFIGWKEDVRYQYHLFPKQRLRVEKPKNQILVHISPQDYDENIPLQRENFHVIKKISHTLEKDAIVITLDENEIMKEGEKLLFRNQVVDWERISKLFTGNITSIVDGTGKQYAVETSIEKKDHFEIIMKDRVPVGVTLIVAGISSNYSEITPPQIRNARLKDKEGFLEFYEIKKNLIQTLRPISGMLRIENGPTFNYKLDENSNDREGDGVKVVLFDPMMNVSTADDEIQNRVDLFLDIISASKDKEVWETPKFPPDDKRIKVRKMFKEEGTLLLERLPTVDKIYPPNISYQLEVQKRAIEKLMYFPSLPHRPLLRLFESKAEATWPTLGTDYDENNVTFAYLNTNKESTPQQQKFVLKALNTPDFAILEGPPGSGKTTAITELIFQLLKRQKRILLSSSTNVAVDNVLEKLVQRYDGSPDRLMNDGIVPLRIGLEEKVSDDIVPFQIDVRKQRLEEAIKRVDATWFEGLDQSEQEEKLEDLLCNSSNLVCGTTIGIMQYPAIKRIRKQKLFGSPQFDYLIVDEASKTTFQEFLVPAIHAKKWILAGDVRQLAPYTDILYAQLNLEQVPIKPPERKALFVLMKLDFEVKKTRNRAHFIYEDDLPTIQAIYDILVEKFNEDKFLEPDKKRFAGSKFVFFTPEPVIQNRQKTDGLMCFTSEELDKDFGLLTEFFRADVIFTSELNRHYAKFLPASFLYFSPSENDNRFMFRHLAWCRRMNWKPYEYKLPKGGLVSDIDLIYDEISINLQKSWAAEIAWRLKRMHELDMVKCVGWKNPKKYYEASLRALLPAESRDVWRDIRKVAKILFPSILTSLQKGVTQYFRPKEDQTVLSTGFQDEVLVARHVLLEHQNRMHPEISKIPRRLFYSDINALRDTIDVVKGKDREWDFQDYEQHRMIWIDVHGARVFKNQNKKEADEIFKQLDGFLKWVKSQESKGRIREWTIALLTFYEKQRLLFRDMMRSNYPGEGNTKRQTQFKVGKVRVFCYTIDKVQGRETDVVFLSMVQNSRVGFMDCPNRLNVGITRAKYLQVIIGDRAFYTSDRNSSWELTELATEIYPPQSNNSRKEENYGRVHS